MILNAFETYVYLAGALAIGVLAIEVSEGPHFCSSPEARRPYRVWGRPSRSLYPQPTSSSLTQDPMRPHFGDYGVINSAMPVCSLSCYGALDTSEQVSGQWG